jgi:signal transduction histidine kinase
MEPNVSTPDQPSDTGPSREAEEPTAPPPIDVAGARVILVDDDPEMRSHLHRLLSAQFLVEPFEDGAEALKAARAMRPDLVMSDIKRQGLDGLALLRALRADPVTHAVPVLLVTARAGEEPTVEGLEAGADDYIVKPFSDHELLARARAQIANTRLRAQLVAAAERQRFATQVHDALAQTMVGAEMLVTHMLTQWVNQPQAIRDSVRQLHTLMRAAMTETRLLLNELQPETMEHQGLGELIERLAELVRGRLPIDVVFEKIDRDSRPLPTDVRQAFYRIAQESLSNVMKHSGATKVHIIATITRGRVTLQIRDNGRGFDPQAAADGPGMRSMRDRAASIGAMVQVTSAPGKDTEVVAYWTRPG